MVKYYGDENVVPIYVQVENGERLFRAVQREREQKEPKYAELCRRFLADEEDFKEEKLIKAGIIRRYDNTELETCIAQITETIEKLS
jgi:guanylate kinase